MREGEEREILMIFIVICSFIAAVGAALCAGCLLGPVGFFGVISILFGIMTLSLWVRLRMLKNKPVDQTNQTTKEE
jgi:predicted Co/Zn/Cd cation transporter (cation efflux family)